MAAEQDAMCKHDLAPETCSLCKPAPFDGVVYVTGGGASFHRRRDCGALAYGQEMVDMRHGTRAKIEVVSWAVSQERGYKPCRSCARY